MKKSKPTLTLVLFLCACFCLNPQAFLFAEAPGIGSPGAALYHTGTQQFLYTKNATTPMFPASTTKILTAIIILEENQLTETVTIPNDFRNPGGSHIALDHGESLTVEQLLYATLVESANDAALALAIHNAGSQEAFAQKMNDKAAALGASQSNFVNPHGLHHPQHYTTAQDLALIAAYAMENETFRKMVVTQRYTIPATNKKNEVRDYLRTSNRFIRDTGIKMNYKGTTIPIFDPEVEGVKTGYTTEANNCLVSSKAIEGGRIISVILGAGVDNLVYADSKALLDYGLSDFTAKRFISAGDFVVNIKVPGAENAGLDLVAKDTLMSTIPTDAIDQKPEHRIDLIEVPDTAIKAGMVLGTITYSWNGEDVATTELVAARDISTASLVGKTLFQLSPEWFPYYFTRSELIWMGLKLLFALLVWRWFVVHIRRQKRKRIRQAKLRAIRESMKETT